MTPTVVFQQLPGAGVAGQPLSPAVQVQVTTDGKGFPVGNDQVTLTVATGPGDFNPASPHPMAITDPETGIATFSNLVLDTAGDYTFQAADAILAETSSPSADVIVQPAEASQLVVTAFPSTVAEGAPVSITVTAVDPFGNTATDYGGTIHFTSDAAQANLPPDYTFQAGDNGTHTFTGVTFDAPGTATVTANDVGRDVPSGTTEPIAVETVPPDDIQLSLSPPVTQKGQAVTLNGVFADPETTDANTVRISWGDGSADASLGLAVGVHTFAATHVYAAEGDYFPTVFVANTDGEAGEGTAEEQVLPATFGGDVDLMGQPDQTISGAFTDPATGDVLQTSLTLSPGDTGVGEFLAAQYSNVILPPTPGVLQGLASYDFRQHNLGPNDSAQVTLIIHGSLEPGTVPVLLYFDPRTGQEHVFQGFFRVVQEPNVLVVSIVFSDASTPKLTDLGATVFTVAASVPGATTTAAVSSSVASANPAATAPVQTATFQSTSQLRLTLSTTQLGQVSQSLSTLGDGGGGADGSSSDAADDALAKFLAKELEALWPLDGESAFRLWSEQPQTTESPAAPAMAPDGAPAVPETPEVPHEKQSRGEAPEWLNLGRRFPFSRAVDAGLPPILDGASEVGRNTRNDHEAPPTGPTPLASPYVLTASLIGLGLGISGRRQRKERRRGDWTIG